MSVHIVGTSEILIFYIYLLKLFPPDLTQWKQMVDGSVYLQRHLLLIQRSNQMWVDMRPLLLAETLFPVLSKMIYAQDVGISTLFA